MEEQFRRDRWAEYPASESTQPTVCLMRQDHRIAEPEESQDPRMLEIFQPRLAHPVVSEIPQPDGRTLAFQDPVGLVIQRDAFGLVELGSGGLNELEKLLVLPVRVQPAIDEEDIVPVGWVLIVRPPAASRVHIEGL